MTHDLSPETVARRLEELRALCELTDYLHRARFVTPSRARDQTSAGPAIRPVEARDLEAVRGVLVETWHHTYDALLGVERVREITDSWHAIDNLRGEIGRPGHAFLLAEIGAAVVATGSASRDGELVTLHRLYVHPTQQGTGLGTILLDALLEAVGPGARVELNVEAANRRAIAFYEARGFTVRGRDGDDLVMHRERPEGR